MNNRDKEDTPPRVDPELKKAVLRWEEQAAAAWTRMLRDPHFLRQMWRNVENGFHAQQLISEQLSRHTAALPLLPTRANQEKLQEALQRLEERLGQLDAQVNQLLENEQE